MTAVSETDYPRFIAGTDVDSTAVIDAADEIWREYSASLNAGDLDRWLSLWTDDGIQMPPGESPVVGKDRIRERNQGLLDLYEFDMSITNQEVEAAGDWACSRGVYEATLTPKTAEMRCRSMGST